jgi:hypothetical protein
MSLSGATTTPLGIGLCIVGTILLSLALFTHSMFETSDENLDTGLTSVRTCDYGECRNTALSYTDFYSESEEATRSKVFSFLAFGARFGGLSIFVILAVVAISAAARRRRTGATYVLAAVSLAELILVLGLLLMLPIVMGAGGRVELTGAGLGAYAFIAGCAMITIGAWLLRPHEPRPADELPEEMRL